MRRFLALCAVLLLACLPVRALEINEASRAQLEQVNGLGVATVERILQERAKAPFTDWVDLQRRVKGLSGKRLEQLQARGVRVNGLTGPMRAAPASPAAQERR